MFRMRELEYPFDAGFILANRRKIRKTLLASDRPFIEKKVAVLGGSTTASIVQVLDLFLLNHGIRAQFYESEYGKYYEDAVFSNEKLDEFRPDIVYIHTSNRNVTCPSLSDSHEDIMKMKEDEILKFKEIWEGISRRFGCPIIQNNFEMPLFRLLGNKDASDERGAVNYLSSLNEKFYEYAREHRDFFICDICYISADYGLRKWSDPFYWHMYRYAMNADAVPALSFNVANIIKSVFGKNKKGLVLDLDNTLWGGVIGDDGAENIQIGPETSAGQVYSEFQNYLKSQEQLGIVLAIDSKNDRENALAGLEHPDSILSPDDFVEIRANWENKDENFNDISQSLSLLPESLVFVDDNPAERHIITESFPLVSAPDIGQSHEYALNIDRNGYFEATYLTEDDLKRTEMYKENAERTKARAGFSDYGLYLDSLEMTAEIGPFEPLYMERISQLTNKSNQFNLTTKRYTQSELGEIAGSDEYITLSGRLKDRFGDNGIVSLCIGQITDGECHIILWLMSCRVLKRDMEYAMMDALVKKCTERGITSVTGYYYPTAKNSMVKDFYGNMGFEKIHEDGEGSTWKLELDGRYENMNRHIKVVSSFL